MRSPAAMLWSVLDDAPSLLGIEPMESNLTFRQRKERRELLTSWLSEMGQAPDEVDRRLRELAQTDGDDVFSDLISVLTHLEMSPEDAQEHWAGIREHRRRMCERMGSDIDIRVATLDYLLTVSKLIDNPKIVEIYVFDQARESAITDGLTEVYNYRYFQLSLRHELARSRRHEKVFSVVLLDLDGFKGYNDTCGHVAGDDALRKVARILMDNTRGLDLVARCGGDEFALLLPEVGHEGAEILAGRLVQRVAEADFPGQEKSPTGPLTASAGIASFPLHGGEARALMMNADQALYRVKESGKGAVAIADPVPQEPPEGEIGVEVIEEDTREIRKHH